MTYIGEPEIESLVELSPLEITVTLSSDQGDQVIYTQEVHIEIAEIG